MSTENIKTPETKSEPEQARCAVDAGSASVLRAFNAWRRDECDYIEPPATAQRIGKAIDDAISALEPWREAKEAPEEKTEVLATYVGVYGPCLGNLIGKRFYPYQEHCIGTEPFTHWMRIPTPPNK